MKLRLVQCFCAALAVSLASGAELEVGGQCHCSFTDIAGRQITLDDGRVTVLTIVTRANQHDARIIGDRVPQRYYADAAFRFVTIVNLQNFPALLRRVTPVFIRRRFELEAQRLEPVYRAKKSSRNPRDDVFIVADFDGSALSQVGLPAANKNTVVFVFDGGGRVIARSNQLLSGEELAAALERARPDASIARH